MLWQEQGTRLNLGCPWDALEGIRSSKQAGRTDKRTWDAVGMLRQEKGTRLNLGCSGDALGANSGKPDVTTLSMQADGVKECIQNAVRMHLG